MIRLDDLRYNSSIRPKKGVVNMPAEAGRD